MHEQENSNWDIVKTENTVSEQWHWRKRASPPPPGVPPRVSALGSRHWHGRTSHCSCPCTASGLWSFWSGKLNETPITHSWSSIQSSKKKQKTEAVLGNCEAPPPPPPLMCTLFMAQMAFSAYDLTSGGGEGLWHPVHLPKMCTLCMAQMAFWPYDLRTLRSGGGCLWHPDHLPYVFSVFGPNGLLSLLPKCTSVGGLWHPWTTKCRPAHYR